MILTSNALGLFIGANFSFISRDKPKLPIIANLGYLIFALFFNGVIGLTVFFGLISLELYFFVIALNIIFLTKTKP